MKFKVIFSNITIILYYIKNDMQLSDYTGIKLRENIIYNMRNHSKHKHEFPNIRDMES